MSLSCIFRTSETVFLSTKPCSTSSSPRRGMGLTPFSALLSWISRHLLICSIVARLFFTRSWPKRYSTFCSFWQFLMASTRRFCSSSSATRSFSWRIPLESRSVPSGRPDCVGLAVALGSLEIPPCCSFMTSASWALVRKPFSTAIWPSSKSLIEVTSPQYMRGRREASSFNASHGSVLDASRIEVPDLHRAVGHVARREAGLPAGRDVQDQPRRHGRHEQRGSSIRDEGQGQSRDRSDAQRHSQVDEGLSGEEGRQPDHQQAPERLPRLVRNPQRRREVEGDEEQDE